MSKDIFAGTIDTDNNSKKEVSKIISDSSKSTKSLSEILKGIRKVGQPENDVDININVNSNNGVLIVLLDTSSSMAARFETSTRIDTATSVLRSQLIPNMLNWKYGIIKFGGEPKWYVNIKDAKNNSSLLVGAVAHGSTYLMSGLRMAWNWIKNQDKGVRIILISDGEPTDASKEMILELSKINSSIPIDTVGIGDNKMLYGYDPVFLRELSRITGGIFCEAHSIKQLSNVIFKLSPAERPLLGIGTTTNNK